MMKLFVSDTEKRDETNQGKDGGTHRDNCLYFFKGGKSDESLDTRMCMVSEQRGEGQ